MVPWTNLDVISLQDIDMKNKILFQECVSLKPCSEKTFLGTKSELRKKSIIVLQQFESIIVYLQVVLYLVERS